MDWALLQEPRIPTINATKSILLKIRSPKKFTDLRYIRGPYATFGRDRLSSGDLVTIFYAAEARL
jgi:hypothetical protein